jgi:hypothetical protein
VFKIFTAVLLFALTASAVPIKPKIEDVLKDVTKPRNDYPVARVGWEEARSVQAPRNLIYEQMRYPYTREGLLAEFVAVSIPDWRITGLLGLLIVTLRHYRYRRPLPGVQAVPEAQRGVAEPLERAA